MIKPSKFNGKEKKNNQKLRDESRLQGEEPTFDLLYFLKRFYLY